MADDPDQPINILILGSGAREHALGWKLAQSPRCGRLYFAPGNGGTEALGDNVALAYSPANTKNADAIDYFARHHDVSLIVIGPEAPLCEGLVDRLQRSGDRRRRVFGPTRAAAHLEADKAWAKRVMRSAAIPTAESRTFTDLEAAVSYCQNHETPVVVKAAGLAEGKGAIVCDNAEQSVEAVRRCLEHGEFGDAGRNVVIEERLVGQEVSILALVDGRSLYLLDPTQDHKPVGEGDTGPNTGGLGAYSPTPLVDEALQFEIERQILVPTVDALRREEVEFRGVLYAGLMLTAGGPKVLEYNVRFGDPECQPLMMRLRGDLLHAMIAVCDRRLDEVEFDWDPRPCCCVVMASGGYPGAYAKHKTITGIDQAEASAEAGDVRVFHAGTKLTRDRELQTAGGRVLSVCALGEDLEAARDRANLACEKIRFEGAYHRRDIGSRVLTPGRG